MTSHCPDCGRLLPDHGPECPAQPYPSIAIEQQIEPDQTPAERYQARRELEGWVMGEKRP